MCMFSGQEDPIIFLQVVVDPTGVEVVKYLVYVPVCAFSSMPCSTLRGGGINLEHFHIWGGGETFVFNKNKF